MSCKYCFYCDEMAKREQELRGFMTEQTLKNVIRKTMLNADKVVNYAFQGGEPTLIGLDFFRTVIDLQKHFNRTGLVVHNAIQTNGLHINEEWCRFFRENNFLVGVSVDGTKEIHDSMRCRQDGTGTYDRIMENIAMLEKYGVQYNILTVVSKPVAENLKQIYADYKVKGWEYQQYIACLDPYGEERGQSPYSLTPKQYGQFLIDLFRLWSADIRKGCQPNIRQLENFAGAIMGYQPESCDQRGICSVQNVVEADGSVYPCDFYAMDEYLLGNFNTDRLVRIQEKAAKSGFVERSLQLTDQCRTCKYFTFCKGGCQRNRVEQEKSGLYQNYFCESYTMFFDECLEEFKELIRLVSKR